jgi:hypothetical protein
MRIRPEKSYSLVVVHRRHSTFFVHAVVTFASWFFYCHAAQNKTRSGTSRETFRAQGSPLFRAKPLIHSQGFLSAQLLLWRDGVSGVFLNKNGPETVIKIYGEEPENIENERTLERTEDRNQQDSDSNSEASIDCGSSGWASRRCHGSTRARGVGCSEAVRTPRLTPICESRGDEGLCCRLIQRLEARCDTADAHRKRPMGGQPHYHTRTSRISVCRRWPMGARSESARNRSQSVWRTQFGAGRFDVVDVPEYDPASCEEDNHRRRIGLTLNGASSRFHAPESRSLAGLQG